ncbi:hypothetical protein [Microcella sp.]|uniref:Rv1678 family membrane protein n=1 Tax=Microcella sp. TaxID=1913979 RepID=UPI00391AA2AC
MTVIGVGSIISAVFVFTPSLPEYIDFVDLEPAGAAVFLALGVSSIVAGIRRSALLSAAAAVGFALAALAQLAQLATGVALLGGDASSLSLFVAGTLGVTCLLWADRTGDPDLDSRNG